MLTCVPQHSGPIARQSPNTRPSNSEIGARWTALELFITDTKYTKSRPSASSTNLNGCLLRIGHQTRALFLPYRSQNWSLPHRSGVSRSSAHSWARSLSNKSTEHHTTLLHMLLALRSRPETVGPHVCEEPLYLASVDHCERIWTAVSGPAKSVYEASGNVMEKWKNGKASYPTLLSPSLEILLVARTGNTAMIAHPAHHRVA